MYLPDPNAEDPKTDELELSLLKEVNIIMLHIAHNFILKRKIRVKVSMTLRGKRQSDKHTW